jgi:hypothetical protein
MILTGQTEKTTMANGTNPEYVDFCDVLLQVAAIGGDGDDAQNVCATHDFIVKNSQTVNGPLKGECDAKGRATTALATLEYVAGAGLRPDWATHSGASFDHGAGAWTLQS